LTKYADARLADSPGITFPFSTHQRTAALPACPGSAQADGGQTTTAISQYGSREHAGDEPVAQCLPAHPPHAGALARTARGARGPRMDPDHGRRNRQGCAGMPDSRRSPCGRPTAHGKRRSHICTPKIFGQLRAAPEPLTGPPPAPPHPTSTERNTGKVRPLLSQARGRRRTSQRSPRVERFVIECFAPSCHVDIAAGGELAPQTTYDPVDSILAIHGGGLVQDRGETCRTERTRPPRGA
jgi:hypothetical protein